MTHTRRPSGSDRLVARFSLVRQLFSRPCPECRAAIPLSRLAAKHGGWPQIATCTGCGARFRLADRLGRFLLKACFVGFPLVLLALWISGAVLNQIPFFVNDTPSGPNDVLRFRAFPIIIAVFFLTWAFFLRRLPLKKETS